MEIPYYLNPNPPAEDDLLFNIPITKSPPSVVYTEGQIKSIWENGLEGAQIVVSDVYTGVTEYVSTTIDSIKQGTSEAFASVKSPFENFVENFKMGLWLMIAGTLTLVYLAMGK